MLQKYHVAINLLGNRIDEAIEADDGISWKIYLKKALSESTDITSIKARKKHLGCSAIGGLCERKIWLDYHDINKEKLNARLFRLFNRGHMEEPRVIASLRTAGLTVYTTNPKTGKQFEFLWYDGLFSGSCDGLIDYRKSFLEKYIDFKYSVLEIKTMNDSSFKATVKKGVMTAHPGYYDQMQMYIEGAVVNHALFIAVNKNDDSLYLEFVDRDQEQILYLIDKAARILNAERKEDLIVLNNPGINFGCAWCAHKGACL